MSGIKKNWLEWGVFGLSLLILATVIGLLAWDAVSAHDRPPSLRVGQPTIARHRDALEATVELTNAGDQAAEQVTVEVQLSAGGGGESQRGSFQIDLLPGGASQSGTVVFFSPPAGELRAEASVAGYQRP